MKNESETELLRKIVDACNRSGVTQVPAGTHRPDLEELRALLNEARPLTPSGAGEAVSDEAVEAAKDAYGKASLSAGFSGYVDPHWMRAALTAALPYLRPAQSQEGVKMKWLTGQELWEIMFTALKGDVPDKLTDTALDEIASAVRCAALTPQEGGE